jgi:hypothetical protein
MQSVVIFEHKFIENDQEIYKDLSMYLLDINRSKINFHNSLF